MKKGTKKLCENVEELFNQKKFDEIIAMLTDEVLEKEKNVELYLLRGNTWDNKKEYDKAILDYNKAIKINPKNAELYVLRGITWYNKKDYDSAILDYTKALEIKPDYELAFYNRGLAWVADKEYDKAIEDYNIVIELDSDYKDVYYNDRGIAWKAKKEYGKAIDDYIEAIKINPDSPNAYYNRGLAKKENNIDLEGSKQDFERYLKLATDEDDLWAKYARYYIKELDVMIKNPVLRSIIQLVKDIKGKLLIEEECVHYTKFCNLKKLILEESKFIISEGNFLNDPSEGEEFFNFLKYKPHISGKDGASAETFSPKPFIGSFVTKDKHNDLNMWRFYGKEEGIEAKGCAITLCTQEFIDDIKGSLSNEKNKEARLDDESDISFYRVVYVVHGPSISFYISNSDKKSNELKKLMTELKTKVDKVMDKTFLEKYLNNIAFLFKSDAYKNENEVRLVVKGIEFEKKYDMDVIPPRVYIELESIKKRVKQITLGPKVDNVNEWASAFHYSYKEDAPKIIISHLPYK
ncbi:MAG: tetratricopeptide repeat protein [Mangrovibacterium sp.]